MNALDPEVRRGEKICEESALEDSGIAFRFRIQYGEISSFQGANADPEDWLSAFLIRYQGSFRAFLNRCAHLPMEMDWNPGALWDEEGRHIVCSTHYAVYEPLTGQCISGPCPKGATLIQIPITQKGSAIFFG